MSAPISRAHNPLRDPDDRRLNRIAGPSALVIFGVTGDLSRKKLMPAVYDLANRGLLPPGFALVGFARRDWEDQDFAEVVHDSVRQYARTPFREETWKQLSEGIRFVQGTFDDPEAFAELRRTVEALDAERGTHGNHAFYLSIPPKSFPLVTEQLKRWINTAWALCKKKNACGNWTENLMLAADHLIEMGPGAGIDGGRIVFEGTPAELIAAKKPTLTGEYLAAYVAG